MEVSCLSVALHSILFWLAWIIMRVGYLWSAACAEYSIAFTSFGFTDERGCQVALFLCELKNIIDVVFAAASDVWVMFRMAYRHIRKRENGSISSFSAVYRENIFSNFHQEFLSVFLFWLVSKWYCSLFSVARRIHFISIIAMAFFFFLLLCRRLFSHWFMSQMQKLFFCSLPGGAVYERQTKKLRGKIMSDNGCASHNTHYTILPPAWLSCFEICNKLMLLKIFSVSTYIHFGRSEQQKMKLKLTGFGWRWGCVALAANARIASNQIHNGKKWNECEQEKTVRHFSTVGCCYLAARWAATGADWRHLASGWKWRHWFALRFSLGLWTELNVDIRTRNDTHSDSQHFNNISLLLLVVLLLMMCFSRRNDR